MLGLRVQRDMVVRGQRVVRACAETQETEGGVPASSLARCYRKVEAGQTGDRVREHDCGALLQESLEGSWPREEPSGKILLNVL